eukprot:1061197-Amphidinium_carterae.3
MLTLQFHVINLSYPQVHTSVVHQIKRVNRVWVQPVFSKLKTITLSNADKVDIKTGTQTIDGFWKHLRSCINGNAAKDELDSDTLDGMIRFSQFQSWAHDRDPLPCIVLDNLM